jgi:hypothetical protein
MGKVAFVRDCRRIGSMGVTYKLGIIDYSVSGYCGGGRDSGVKGVGGEEGKEKKEREKRRKRKEEKRRQKLGERIESGIREG